MTSYAKDSVTVLGLGPMGRTLAGAFLIRPFDDRMEPDAGQGSGAGRAGARSGPDRPKRRSPQADAVVIYSGPEDFYRERSSRC
jgi:hypothetical protein